MDRNEKYKSERRLAAILFLIGESRRAVRTPMNTRRTLRACDNLELSYEQTSRVLDDLALKTWVVDAGDCWKPFPVRAL